MVRQTTITITVMVALFVVVIAHAAENRDNVFITTQSYEAIKTGNSRTEIVWEARVFNNNDHAVDVVIEALFYCRTSDGNTILDTDTSVLTLAPKEAKNQSGSFCANGALRNAVDSSMPVDLVIEIRAVDVASEEDEDSPQ